MGAEKPSNAIDQLELTEYSALEYLGVNSWGHRKNLALGKQDPITHRTTRVTVFALLILGLAGSLAWGLLVAKVQGLIAAGIVIGLGFIWTRILKQRAPDLKSLKMAHDLDRLFEGIEQHNRMVARIKVLDRLKDAGNEVDLENRDKAVAVLRQNRESYIKGLKTIRILAQSSESLSDLSDFQSMMELPPLAIENEVTQYASIVDASIGGHVRVRESMKGEQEAPRSTPEG